MLINSMPTASATGATVERDDMGTAAVENSQAMMPADLDETHPADCLAAAITDSI
jgi:hypothetical protein